MLRAQLHILEDLFNTVVFSLIIYKEMHPSAEAVHFLKWLKTHNPPDRKSFFFMLLEC